MTVNILRGLLAALLLSAALPAATAHADAVADFYKGKSLTLVIGSLAGAGYDTLGRIVASHLGRHVPGQPNVVVRNMPGAGSILATNYLYNTADKDGTIIGLPDNNTPFEPLFGTTEAQYDSAKFGWLGSPSSETGILVVWKTVPVDSIADAKLREVTLSASGANSNASL